MFRIGRKLWIAVTCVLVLGAVSPRMQESQFEEPVPEKVVDPKPAILNGRAVSAKTTVALHVALVRTVVPANVP